MLVGPASTKAEIEAFRERLIARPDGYIAQPYIGALCVPRPSWNRVSRRAIIDLRPFVLSGKEVTMAAGGLTRVALKEGSLVVNSSQGGARKTPGWWTKHPPGLFARARFQALRPRAPHNNGTPMMLSRTADHLFWMARYMERAENTARMLDINLKGMLLPQTPDQAARAQRSVLRISELESPGSRSVSRARIRAEDMLHFMVADTGNPSSIILPGTRPRNARAVRGTLTRKRGRPSISQWLEIRRETRAGEARKKPRHVFEWVKYRSNLCRGVMVGTALQDDRVLVLQLGMYLERADNTARILDVRFADAEPTRAKPRSTGRLYYWTSILSSVSSLEIYRKVYRDVVTPSRVVELLILNSQMPRSLLASLDGSARRSTSCAPAARTSVNVSPAAARGRAVHGYPAIFSKPECTLSDRNS